MLTAEEERPSLPPTEVQNSNPCRDEMEGYDGAYCGSRSTQVNHDTCKTPLRMPGMPQRVGPVRPRTEWFFEILLEQMTVWGVSCSRRARPAF